MRRLAITLILLATLLLAYRVAIRRAREVVGDAVRSIRQGIGSIDLGTGGE